MSAVASPRTGSFLTIASFVVIIGAFVAAVVVVQQALVASSPSGYQVAILNIARQIGLAPPQPTFGDPPQAPAGYGFGFAARGGNSSQLNAAAQTMGMSVGQLRRELTSASLTQVAEAHGADPGAVASAMKSASDAQVDAAVASGRLTPADAAQRKVQADQRVEQLMTQVAPSAGLPSERPRSAQP